MTQGLLLPSRRVPAPEPPERIALDLAFGAGNPAILGDKSRYNSHGIIVGAVPAIGLHGLCLDFNAAGPDRVRFPWATCTQLAFTGEDFSFVIRIRFDSLVGSPQIVSKYLWNTHGYWFRCNAGGDLSVLTFQAAANQSSSSALGSVVINTWYTLGVSRNGASIRIYQNGVDITAVAGVHINPVLTNRNFLLGCDNAIAAGHDGLIEFFRAFTGVALATSEHLAWHNALA
ncbi:MAG: hypothetical protein KAT75_04250 [Dehalococcoidia bacterium]|nr:hypothetical protein [Dehalococcoidia bacterium]